MDILIRCSDGSHVRFYTVYPSLLWSSSSSSPSCSHIVVGSLRQTRFSSSQFCRGHPPPPLRWLMSDFAQSIHLCFGFPLLLLVVPMLWGCCGRHNSPPASSVVDILLRCPDGARVGFHTVYPSLLWSSSSSFSSSSASSCSHVVVGSLRQTQFSSSQFWHGHPPPPHRWLTSDFAVYPSPLWSSSSSSPGWCHLQCSSSHVFLFSSLYKLKPPQSRFHTPVCDLLYLHSLLDVLISHMVS